MKSDNHLKNESHQILHLSDTTEVKGMPWHMLKEFAMQPHFTQSRLWHSYNEAERQKVEMLKSAQFAQGDMCELIGGPPDIQFTHQETSKRRNRNNGMKEESKFAGLRVQQPPSVPATPQQAQLPVSQRTQWSSPNPPQSIEDHGVSKADHLAAKKRLAIEKKKQQTQQPQASKNQRYIERETFKSGIRLYGRDYCKIAKHMGRNKKEVMAIANKFIANARANPSMEGSDLLQILEGSNDVNKFWSIDEHMKFLDAVRKHGANWLKVSQAVGTKIQGQVISYSIMLREKIRRNPNLPGADILSILEGAPVVRTNTRANVKCKDVQQDQKKIVASQAKKREGGTIELD